MRGPIGGFTIAEAVVSVVLLGLVLAWVGAAYGEFNRSEERMRSAAEAKLFSRYLQETLDAQPPGTGSLIPAVGETFYMQTASNGAVTYSKDPSKKSGETGFMPGGTMSWKLSHEISLVSEAESYGFAMRLYRINGTYEWETATAYLSKRTERPH